MNVAVNRRIIVSLILVLTLTQSPRWGGVDEAHAAQPAGRLIRDTAIRQLQEDLAATAEIESTTARRLALKRVVRRAASLLDEYPASPNRFQLLGLVLQTQQELLVLRNDQRNREALLETCRKLRDAPDAYALERLPADVLLMQLELGSRGATEHEQAESIAELADRYRDTPAEADSLIVASELAFNLGEADLLRAFRGTLSSKFRESAKAIGFLKDRFASKSSSLMFRGHFKRLDGEEIVFPIDRAGHVYLSCFWSTRLHDLKERLFAIRDLQQKYPGRFEVFSFNLDELPDAGKSTLDALGLDWTPMHLPGGSENPLFRACGSDPQFLIRITNANGYVILTPIGSTYRTFGRVTDLDEYLNITLDEPRFLSLTQTVRIGDFLVLNPFGPLESNFPPGWQTADVPADSLRAICACFVAPPLRYRLTKEEALKNYAKAAALCAEVMAEHGGSERLWYVCNRRIIALLGLWNLSGEPKYRREAVAAATTVLATDIPRDAQLVPRFCLAKDALRRSDADPEAVLSEFVKAAGGDKASGLAIAAATVLGLDAGSPVLYQEFREELLNEHMDDPRLWSVTAYFFNRFVNGRLFRGNYYSADVRVYVGFRDWQKQTETRPRQLLLKLAALTGDPVEFPDSDQDKSNVVVFMEPPADAASAKVQNDLVRSLEALAKAHTHKNVNLVLAFVSEDTAAVKALAQKNGWEGAQIALVPDGLKNPHVVRLGIFLADQRPNTFVVAPDGTITWAMTGMYQMAVGISGVSRAVKEFVQEEDLHVAQAVLEQGNYEKALRMFEGSFPPDPRAGPELGTARREGKARAYAGLRQWHAALHELDAVLAEHAKRASLNPCACYSLARKLRARADILEDLGKKTEAAVDRQRAERLVCPRGGSIKFNPDRSEQELFSRLQGYMPSHSWQAAFEYIDDIIVHGKDGRQGEREALAGLLRERAEVLTHLGDGEKATDARQWAEALTRGIEAPVEVGGSQRPGSLQPRRYVDVVH